MLLSPLYALLQIFVARSALVPLQPLVIPETVLSVDSLLSCHYKQIVIQPAHASFPVLLFRARVHLVHHQLVRHSRSQWQRSVARWWKGAAFTEKMNVKHENEKFVDVESRGSGREKRNADPPPEFTGTKPSEFKSYRKKLRRWLLFTRTPAQLQGPHVLGTLTGPAWDACDGLEPEDVATAGGVNMILDTLAEAFRCEHDVSGSHTVFVSQAKEVPSQRNKKETPTWKLRWQP